MRQEWKAQASVPRQRRRRRRQHSNQITNNWIYCFQFAQHWLILLLLYRTTHTQRFHRNFPLFFTRCLLSFGHRSNHEVKRKQRRKKITHTRVNWSVFELKLIGGKSLRVEKFDRRQWWLRAATAAQPHQWTEQAIESLTNVWVVFAIAARSQCKVSLRRTDQPFV